MKNTQALINTLSATAKSSYQTIAEPSMKVYETIKPSAIKVGEFVIDLGGKSRVKFENFMTPERREILTEVQDRIIEIAIMIFWASVATVQEMWEDYKSEHDPINEALDQIESASLMISEGVSKLPSKSFPHALNTENIIETIKTRLEGFNAAIRENIKVDLIVGIVTSFGLGLIEILH